MLVLSSPCDDIGPLLWGHRLWGGGKVWVFSFTFSSRAAEPVPGHRQEKGLKMVSWSLGLTTASRDGDRES